MSLMAAVGRRGVPAMWVGLVCAMPAWPHMVSISHGEVRVQRELVRYELRMPLYEIEHIRRPDQLLLSAIRFYSAGIEGSRIEQDCETLPIDEVFVCRAAYRFPAIVDRLSVECRFHEVTVPNHVHLLRALKEGDTGQAVLDASFSRAELRFQPPTGWERLVREALAGALRVAGEAAPLLFVLAMVVAARSRRELLLLVLMFVLGQALACLLAPRTNWLPSPRFVESAAALTVAYLAVEVLLLPRAGMRWLVVGVLGLFHGLYLVLLVRATGFNAAYVLAGAGVSEASLAALLAGIGWKLSPPPGRFRPGRILAAVLLGIGLAWFFWRLRG